MFAIVPYEILDHPSELRLGIYGETLEALFSNAVLAMADILKGDSNYPLFWHKTPRRVAKHSNDSNKKTIKIKSIDINSLLVDFLSEILARSQINKAVYDANTIKIVCHPESANWRTKDLIGNDNHVDEVPRSARNNKRSGKCLLEAVLIGHQVDHFDEDIKAVTYEDLDIKQVDGIWQTMIVFDI